MKEFASIAREKREEIEREPKAAKAVSEQIGELSDKVVANSVKFIKQGELLTAAANAEIKPPEKGAKGKGKAPTPASAPKPKEATAKPKEAPPKPRRGQGRQDGGEAAGPRAETRRPGFQPVASASGLATGRRLALVLVAIRWIA